MPAAVGFELAIDVQAAPERVWAVMMEVERWPEWTASMRSVRRIEAGPLAPGKGVRMRQTGLPPVTWRVTELVAGERFTWVSRSPGLVSSASHALERRGAGRGSRSRSGTRACSRGSSAAGSPASPSAT